MLVSDFNFDLPPELIAQHPLADRSASRMLHLSRHIGEYQDCKFIDFPELLRPDDLLVVNNSRVFPARLFGRRTGLRAQPVSPKNPAARNFLQAQVEVLLTRQLGPCEWQALVRPGRKLGVGEQIVFGEHQELKAEIIARRVIAKIGELDGLTAASRSALAAHLSADRAPDPERQALEPAEEGGLEKSGRHISAGAQK